MIERTYIATHEACKRVVTVVNISLHDCVHASITIPLISPHSYYSKPFMILPRYSYAMICFYAYFMIFKESLIDLQDVR